MDTHSQPTPEPKPSETESINTVVVVIDGPGDNTRRPRRPSIPYTPPPDAPPSGGKDKPKDEHPNP